MARSVIRNALILGALTAVGPLAIDMYLPAFPAIARDLKTDVGAVQMSLVSFFIALALGQSIYGPLSDLVGRRPPLFIGIALYTLAAVGCAFVNRVDHLVVLRFFQGLGGCAGMVIARAVVRDLHSGTEAVRMFSLILAVMGVAPVVAPIAGSMLVEWLSWHAIFWVGAGFGMICLLLMLVFLPETNPRERRQTRSAGGSKDVFRALVQGYAFLLRDRRFRTVVVMAGFAQAGLFAYLAGSSFLFQELHGVSARTYSVIFATNAIALIGGAQFNATLIRRFGAECLIRTATLAYAAAAAALLVLSVLHHETLGAVTVCLFVCFASLGFILPPSTMLALEPHGQIAGVASALMGTLQFAFGAASSAVVSALFNGTSLPLLGTLAACGVGALVLSRVALKGRCHQVHESIAMAPEEQVL